MTYKLMTVVAVQGAYGVGPLECRNRRLESRSSLDLFRLLLYMLCVGTRVAASRSLVRGVLPDVKKGLIPDSCRRLNDQ
jgi:hypothetical protein